MPRACSPESRRQRLRSRLQAVPGERYGSLMAAPRTSGCEIDGLTQATTAEDTPDVALDYLSLQGRLGLALAVPEHIALQLPGLGLARS